MNTKLNKLFMLWNIVLGVALLLSLGVNAWWAQAANDPPVRIYNAAPEAGGGTTASTTNAPDIIGVDGLTDATTILTLNVKPSGTNQWTCLLFGNVQAHHNGAGQYSIHLWKGNGRIVDSIRSYEFTANADNDEGVIIASAMTIARKIPSNGATTTFKLAGNKNSAGTPNGLLGNGALTAICFDTKLK
ncbi:MAG: hypothetical protein HY741_10665 [Chloroflexi bacterium]|nr:hypothetical protein [Chloroflexota bacterium]